ncbi:sulfotransferase [Roseobacteraceae bacterium NS-SX3]
MLPKANPDLLLSELNRGKYKSVLKQAKAAMKSKSAPPVFANLAGIALCGLGQQRESIPMFQKALAMEPGFHDARNNLAQTLILLKQPQKALKQLETVLKAEPGNLNALYLSAQAHWSAGALEAAHAALNRSLGLAPGQARAFALRALVRNALGLEHKALADFEQAIALNPNDVEALVNASLPLARQLRHEDSQAVISRALTLAPDHIGANLRQGALHLESGEKQKAAEAFQRVLDLSPGQPDALQQLAALVPAGEADILRPQLRKALQAHKRPSENRARLHFAEASLNKLSDDDEGFAASLAKANGDMAALFPYPAEDDTRETAAILGRFPPGSAPAAATAAGPRPVFVTGMPRSGTTLAEAVIGAHPRAAPLGERAAAGALLRPYLDGSHPFGETERARFAEDYTARLPELPEGTDVYSDKMPENYRYIGFLATAFPAARFVCLERDPRDTALSMWQAHFSGRALAYSYDLETMAHRFNLHARMMRHWKQVLPDRILTVRYEEMTRDIEGTSRRIAEFTGLNWVPAMAAPGESAAKVLTLSASQLRQKVHSRSVGGWARHAGMLRPFIENLDPELWPEIAG